jgi:hypothetical protein
MRILLIIICILIIVSCEKEKQGRLSQTQTEPAKNRIFVINDSSKLTPYPFKDDYEKYQKEYQSEKKALLKYGIIIDDFPGERPTFQVLDINDDTLDFFGYFRSPDCDFPPDLEYLVTIDIGWTGEIWRIELLKTIGSKPKDFNLNEFVKRLIAKPAIKNGVAVPYRYSVSLKRLKN